MMKKVTYLSFLLLFLGFSSLFAVVPYSVNLMWVNARLDESQQYVHPAKDKAGLYQNFLNPIFKWASISKSHIIINVWFDSVMSSAQAVENTRSVIAEETSSHPEWAPIVLKDIRMLPKVAANPEIFSDKMPIFFRVDLARVIAAVEAIQTNKTSSFVYADLDMEPLPEQELFDTETMHNLREYGTVMARGSMAASCATPYENTFFIISGNNANLIEALTFALIELNVVKGYEALSGGKLAVNRLKQKIFDSYRDMFKYFYHLEGRGTLMVQWQEIYRKEKHAFQPFGHFESSDDLPYQLMLRTNDKYLTKRRFVSLLPVREIRVPTKSVPAPRSAQLVPGFDHTKISQLSPLDQAERDKRLMNLIFTICNCSVPTNQLIVDLIKPIYDLIGSEILTMKDGQQKFECALLFASMPVSNHETFNALRQLLYNFVKYELRKDDYRDCRGDLIQQMLKHVPRIQFDICTLKELYDNALCLTNTFYEKEKFKCVLSAISLPIQAENQLSTYIYHWGLGQLSAMNWSYKIFEKKEFIDHLCNIVIPADPAVINLLRPLFALAEPILSQVESDWGGAQCAESIVSMTIPTNPNAIELIKPLHNWVAQKLPILRKNSQVINFEDLRNRHVENIEKMAATVAGGSSKLLAASAVKPSSSFSQEHVDQLKQIIMSAKDEYGICSRIQEIVTTCVPENALHNNEDIKILFDWVISALPFMKYDFNKIVCIDAIASMIIPADPEVSSLLKPVFSWVCHVIPELNAHYLANIRLYLSEIKKILAADNPDYDVVTGLTELFFDNATKLSELQTSITQLLAKKEILGGLLTEEQWEQIIVCSKMS